MLIDILIWCHYFNLLAYCLIQAMGNMASCAMNRVFSEAVWCLFLLIETPPNSRFIKYTRKKLLNYSSVIRQLRSKLRTKWNLGPEGKQLVLSLEVHFGSKIASEQREPAAKTALESNLGATDKDSCEE